MNAKDLIIKHEDMALRPYIDSVGKLTIGFGHNLDDLGISRLSAEFILEEDIATAKEWLEEIFDVDSLPSKVQVVMLDMMFNLGYNRFKGFKKMIAAVKAGDYKLAAEEAKDSKWCKQVGSRCEDNYNILISTVTKTTNK